MEMFLYGNEKNISNKLFFSISKIQNIQVADGVTSRIH